MAASTVAASSELNYAMAVSPVALVVVDFCHVMAVSLPLSPAMADHTAAPTATTLLVWFSATTAVLVASVRSNVSPVEAI